jgi:hypothetical protein
MPAGPIRVKRDEVDVVEFRRIQLEAGVGRSSLQRFSIN